MKRGLAPLYTVFGAETLLALEAGDRIRAQAREAGYSEREVLTAEQHFNWSALKMSGQSQSLFASQRILELRIPGGKPGIEGGKALQNFCAQLPADTITLICLPEIDWRGQQASWFEALDAAGTTVEALPVKRGELPAWLAGRLKTQDQHADHETLEFIADKVEGNLLAAYQEVQKLALLFPPGKLEFDQARQAVLDVARFDVSDLGELVIAGDAQHLARVLDGLQGEGAAAPLVLWAITEEARSLGRLLALLNAQRSMQQAVARGTHLGTRAPEPDPASRASFHPDADRSCAHARSAHRSHDQRSCQRRRVGRVAATRTALRAGSQHGARQNAVKSSRNPRRNWAAENSLSRLTLCLTSMDIQSYMVSIGKHARAASRLVAKADTATKNKALTLTAHAIERDAARLLDANAKDLAAARALKLGAALIDRLTLTEKIIAEMADGLRQIVSLADPIGELMRVEAAAVRHQGRSHACAAWRNRDYL